MPLLSELVIRTYRDLADEAKAVFSTLQIEDFIRGGIADLNRVAPTDTMELIEFTTDPDTGQIAAYGYDIGIELPYRVEAMRLSDGYTTPIPEADIGQTGLTGFTFRKTATGGYIEFPGWYLKGFALSEGVIRVHGYAQRPLPYTVGAVDPMVGLSQDEEYAVRSYAKSAGYDMLAHDRSLFAQWQGQTNNSDVSPTQMMQMASSAKQEWDRHRGLIRVVRRYW